MDIWQTKLAGWIYGAGKALHQLRDPNAAYSDEAAVAELGKLGLELSPAVLLAEQIAGGADWPNWHYGGASAPWNKVSFTQSPALVHPLSGVARKMDALSDSELRQIQSLTADVFEQLIERSVDGSVDSRFSHLSLWRFASERELLKPELKRLWAHLPADVRMPYQSVWDRASLISAFAGVLHDGQPALLTMSIGPVQAFIAQARSTSDLWAGSHLLSSLVWEGLSLLCEELGPDSILYPCLKGVAAVDRWMLESVPEGNRNSEWRARFDFAGVHWLRKPSDENPLFAASLPNKFLAIVPAARAEGLAKRVAERIESKARAWAEEAAEQLKQGLSRLGSPAAEQIATQLAGFPDSSWSVAEWPVPEDGNLNAGLSQSAVARLQSALAAFYPTSAANQPGLFGDRRWQTLQADVPVAGDKLYSPNSGVLYPAVSELGEASLAASKATRAFKQAKQVGYRCTICGEREWLTEDRKLLPLAPRRRRECQSFWNENAGKRGIKKGEFLCAVCTLKRMWPILFCERIKGFLGADEVRRFVVSTHGMALTNSLAKAAEAAGTEEGAAIIRQLGGLLDNSDEPVALPRKLSRELAKLEAEKSKVLRRIPALLDRLAENGDEGRGSARKTLTRLLGERPETYYALLIMDGDRMGAWVLGSEPKYSLKYADVLHPNLREAGHNGILNGPAKPFLEMQRIVSPSYHTAISKALVDFSTGVVRHVIEERHKGRLIYAGGDDVLAMLPVDDLLSAIRMLRAAYSGSAIPGGSQDIEIGSGYVGMDGSLLGMMGEKATASIGAVVAHNQDPLLAVLESLRQAEHQAKGHGRNAFCIQILKRAGGDTGFKGTFSDGDDNLPSTLTTAVSLSEWLAREEVSRRVVYHCVTWLNELPALPHAIWPEVVAKNLAYQMKRQSKKGRRDDAPANGADELALTLANTAWREAVSQLKHAKEKKERFVVVRGEHIEDPAILANRVLEDILTTTEFLARPTHRAGDR
jgi:CRISPR-associated protein Cmr2